MLDRWDSGCECVFKFVCECLRGRGSDGVKQSVITPAESEGRKTRSGVMDQTVIPCLLPLLFYLFVDTKTRTLRGSKNRQRGNLFLGTDCTNQKFGHTHPFI